LKSTAQNDIETIALVEVAGSHDECLLSQMHALKNSGRRVVLVCTPEIKERNPIFEKYVDAYFVTTMTGTGIKDVGIIRAAWKFIKQENATKVVLNTAQGHHVRNLCWMAKCSSVEFIGIIHTTRKFQGSFTQKSINKKVKKYWVLSEHLLQSIEPPRGISIDYFYPIRFVRNAQTVEGRENINITIIGGVENRRKDLVGIVKMIENTPSNSQFTFLGKSDPEAEEVKSFKKQLAANDLLDRVTFYDEFIPQAVFDEALEQTDAILPLIHPNTSSAEQYFKNQIAGAMSVSFGYKIPMLLHEGYAHIAEMKGASMYYTLENFAQSFPTKEQLASKRAEMSTAPRYNLEQQEERYLSFLFA